MVYIDDDELNVLNTFLMNADQMLGQGYSPTQVLKALALAQASMIEQIQNTSEEGIDNEEE